MSDLNKMSGTPWHIEKMHRKDGDERRHRSRCIYYESIDHFCKKQLLQCIGSAHCSYYKEEKIETVIKNDISNQYTGTISTTNIEKNTPKDINEYKTELFCKTYENTPTKTIADKRQKISEIISGDTYSLTKDFFSSEISWERYEYLLCCLEEKIIDFRLARGKEKLQSEIRKNGMEIIENLYNLICRETAYNLITVQKIDFNYINNLYYPLQSFDSIKIALEKCLYYRLNGGRPKIR